MTELRDIVARILTKEGAVRGGGFLAPSGQGIGRHVITCAHVVNAALGYDREKQQRPEKKVCLRLPGISKFVWGDIVEWHPPRRYEELDEKPVSDIAILDIGEQSAGTSLEIARTALPNCSRFRAFGFPGWEQGMPIDGEVLERDNGGWLHVRAVADQDYFAEEGFSGTPVVASEGREVFGVITAVSPDPNKRRAFVIPPDILRRAWPLLAQPYRGLSTFREQDEGYFFGRANFTELLLERVREQTAVLVFGASGSGKSSVVFAGLVPRLRKLGWSIVQFRPGDRPLHALAHAIAPYLEPRGSLDTRIKCAREWASLLDKDATAIHDVAEAIKNDQVEQPLLLIVDQFEELFTHEAATTASKGTAEAERTSFAKVVHEIVSARGDPAPLRLVATLRADFSGYVSGDPILGPAFHDCWLDLPAMNEWQIAEAITHPAAELDVRFETGLSQSIVATMLRGTGLLPLMEFALDQLWRLQANHWLRKQDYLDIHGLEGALAKHADEELDRLKVKGYGEGQVRRALLQLIRVALPGEGEDTKWQRTRNELGEELWPVIQSLADARLVVTAQDIAGNETADIVHEALFRWSKLKKWLDEDRKFLLWRRITELAVSQWRERGKVSECLLKKSLLEEAQNWRRLRPEAIPGEVLSFIDDSVNHQDAERAHENSVRIWDRLDLRGQCLRTRDLDAIYELSTSSISTKSAFVTRLLTSEACAEKLTRRPYLVIRAAIGIYNKLRSETLSNIVSPILTERYDVKDIRTRAAISLAAALILDETQTAYVALEKALYCIMQTDNAEERCALTDAICVLASKTGAKAQDALELVTKLRFEDARDTHDVHHAADTTTEHVFDKAIAAITNTAKAISVPSYVLSTKDSGRELTHIIQHVLGHVVGTVAVSSAEAICKVASYTVAPEELGMIAARAQEVLPSVQQEQRITVINMLLDRIMETLAATSDLADIIVLAQSARTLIGSDGLERSAHVAASVIDRVLHAREFECVGTKSDAPELQLRTSNAGPLEYVLLIASRTTDPAEAHLLYHAAQVLAEILPPGEALRAVVATLDDLSKTDDEGIAQSIAELFGAALQNAEDGNYVGELLNLLKFPTSVGKATEYVLQRLRERFHNLDQPGLDLWTVVVWAEKTFPTLDLASPPRLPSEGVVKRT